MNGTWGYGPLPWVLLEASPGIGWQRPAVKCEVTGEVAYLADRWNHFARHFTDRWNGSKGLTDR